MDYKSIYIYNDIRNIFRSIVYIAKNKEYGSLAIIESENNIKLITEQLTTSFCMFKTSHVIILNIFYSHLDIENKHQLKMGKINESRRLRWLFYLHMATGKVIISHTIRILYFFLLLSCFKFN